MGRTVLVIGAGVVGLASARALALLGNNVLVAEASTQIGGGVSSRNSEVLHAGIYYPTGSLKAKACVQGRAILTDFCTKHFVPFKLCGKLIVATADSQVSALHDMYAKGEANGVKGLRLIESSEAIEMEPALSCVAALHSPNTGIIDSHAYMLALQGELEAHGGVVAFDSRVVGGFLSKTEKHIIRVVSSGSGTETEESELSFDAVVNCTSLHATKVAASFQSDRPFAIPKSYFAKGNYCSFTGPVPFSRLIYPVPKDAGGGLGIHLTLDLQNQARFGPDLEWITDNPDANPDSFNYIPSKGCGQRFEEAVRDYWPAVTPGSLIPSYAGIRPRIHSPGQTAVDFMLQGPPDHEIPGFINCFGVESPGLTSSMALAEEVVRLLG